MEFAASLGGRDRNLEHAPKFQAGCRSHMGYGISRMQVAVVPGRVKYNEEASDEEPDELDEELVDIFFIAEEFLRSSCNLR
jgi:hypothetical protein